MKIVFGLVLSAGLLLSPSLAMAQSINPTLGSPGSSLQGAGVGLQQPRAGVQGTTPQNLTSNSGLSLNQTSGGVSSMSVKLGPSQTSTTITKIPEPKKVSKLPKAIVFSLITVASGLVLWRISAKL